MENLYSCRKCVLFCLCVLFVILSTEAVTKVQLNYDIGEKYKLFELRTALDIKCNVSLSSPDEKVIFSWLKDGVDFSPEKGKSDTKDMSTLSFQFATGQNAGEYTCVAKGTNTLSANVTAVMKPFVKLPANTNVVEGEKLILTCIVHGVPVPKISWLVGGNKTQPEGRVKILDPKDKEKDASHSFVPNAVLQIDEATMDDRATYTCIGETEIGNQRFNSSSDTFVRVKDKMAALWPFLGICLEVIVLCAVILIYEKKRNKTEMDESDTDGSPEQKNTPDHGKDSEVRHRK